VSAEEGMILRIQVGSGVHTNGHHRQDDRGEMGLDLANHSSVGDLDVIVYSVRKWARLALVGNPDRVAGAVRPGRDVVFRDEIGATGPQRTSFRLPAARRPFLGYLLPAHGPQRRTPADGGRRAVGPSPWSSRSVHRLQRYDPILDTARSNGSQISGGRILNQ
jgi:hypothetical protein